MLHAQDDSGGGGSTPLKARAFTAGPGADELGVEVVHYGPDIATEADLRLLGHVEGRRILELGCGGGNAAVALTRQGALVIALDESSEQVGHARRLAEREEVKFDLRHGDLADLAFVRADTIDAALSVHALGTVDDVDRVFRQVHRVLRPEAPFVLSLPHPAFRAVDPAGDPPCLRRSYFDRSPLFWETPTDQGAEHPLTVSGLFTRLTRANFRVDVLLEPEPEPGAPRSSHWAPAMGWLPSTVIMRARKLGI